LIQGSDRDWSATSSTASVMNIGTSLGGTQEHKKRTNNGYHPTDQPTNQPA